MGAVDGRIEARETRAADEVAAAETAVVDDAADDELDESASATADAEDEACSAAMEEAAANSEGTRRCAGAEGDRRAYMAVDLPPSCSGSERNCGGSVAEDSSDSNRLDDGIKLAVWGESDDSPPMMPKLTLLLVSNAACA